MRASYNFGAADIVERFYKSLRDELLYKIFVGGNIFLIITMKNIFEKC